MIVFLHVCGPRKACIQKDKKRFEKRILFMKQVKRSCFYLRRSFISSMKRSGQRKYYQIIFPDEYHAFFMIQKETF